MQKQQRQTSYFLTKLWFSFITLTLVQRGSRLSSLPNTNTFPEGLGWCVPVPRPPVCTHVCEAQREECVCVQEEKGLWVRALWGVCQSPGGGGISSLIHFSWLFSFQIDLRSLYIDWRVDSLLSWSIFWGLGVCVGGVQDGSRRRRAVFHQALITISPNWLLRRGSFADAFRVLIVLSLQYLFSDGEVDKTLNSKDVMMTTSISVFFLHCRWLNGCGYLIGIL